MKPIIQVSVPACPNCGSREHVVRMATSLTPFERPERDDFDQAHYYCHTCAHDFVPDVRVEDQ
jgi:transposase-like protein